MQRRDGSIFDAVTQRRGSDSAKWTRYAGGGDVIPAWVADMDFASPPAVLEALHARVDHGVFGYAAPPPELVAIMLERFERSYGWSIDPSWIVTQPGVVPGLYLACQCAGEPGDDVITPVPAYHHFLSAPGHAGRNLVTSPGRRDGVRWDLDLDRLADTVTDRTRALLLCNPYNPVGRVLARDELETLAALCIERDLMICSDEIHCDLLLDRDKPHVPIASLGPEVAARSITLFSPSKSFNLPGIGGFSIAIIPDPGLRRRYSERSHGVSVHPGALAYHAALVACRDCGDWLEALVAYLAANRDWLEEQVDALPGVSMCHVEGTYLAWLDFGRSGLSRPFDTLLANGLALTDGADLGDPSHLRLNFGCPRATLEEIVARLRKSLP
ncbi:MAG: PatB family C-S lyase [Deltaproteobacteria bacterium]|nr:PatB family C-S lyase [Deltaproteobacteria bacterium]